MPVLRLAIPSPLRRPFDYLPPADTGADELAGLGAGIRVRVPFGRREVTGYLLGVHTQSEAPPDSLRPALEILDPAPLVDAELLALAGWAAAYYHHPPGEVYPALFPRRLREGAPHASLGVAGWRLTKRARGLPEGALSRSPRQAEALALLRDGGELGAGELEAAGISGAIMRTLAGKDLAEKCTIEDRPRAARARDGLALNAEQTAAATALRQQAEGFSCHLLEGVTGSGKTEVYLDLIAYCLERDRQALVLIPEIGLTPQTLERFRRRFDAEIAVFHSGLGEAERYRAWESARAGSAQIVIGTRSAIFTPLAAPGAIIVDEEHDASYKQQDGFRYSARDVAVKRAQLQGLPVLLGSATPSLESVQNARSGRYRHHLLTRRAGGAQLPEVVVRDVRRQPLSGGLSPALLADVEACLDANSQALLFLNRRGYAPTLQCHDCGWLAGCDHCDARLTVHRARGRLRCHHCGADRPLPASCPHCHSTQLTTTGLGTEQAEEELRRRFSRFPVYRVDSDSMSGRGAMAALVTTINRGEPCILLGTQMLTKGHHFPAVALVAVLDADALLFSADFRGEERMAQLLTQVAGRAGRAERPGRVVLQTHYPDHPGVQAMLRQSYSEQAESMLQQRAATNMPPAGQLAVLRTDCGDAETGEQFLQQLRDGVADRIPAGTALIGPLPSPMQRRAGKFRSQLLLTAPDRRSAQAACALLVAQAQTLPARRGLKWTIDVDPQDLF